MQGFRNDDFGDNRSYAKSYNQDPYYDNMSLGRTLDYSTVQENQRSLFLHKLDPNYSNHMHKYLQKKQEMVQITLKISYIFLSLLSIFGFGCMIISQKLVSYQVGSTTPKPPKPTIEVKGTLKAPNATRTRDIMKVLKDVTPLELLEKDGSPQNEALTWIADGDALQLPVPTTKKEANRIFQRYALATFYYATNGVKWNKRYRFLSSNNECDWNESPNNGFFYGAGGCNDNGQITMLALGENNLNGTLPSELAFLSDLNILTLHKNSIFGNVPTELKQLSNVKTLNLYSNLLKGNIDFLCENEIDNMQADCSGKEPNIICSCCTTCCDSGGEGECFDL